MEPNWLHNKAPNPTPRAAKKTCILDQNPITRAANNPITRVENKNIQYKESKQHNNNIKHKTTKAEDVWSTRKTNRNFRHPSYPDRQMVRGHDSSEQEVRRANWIVHGQDHAILEGHSKSRCSREPTLTKRGQGKDSNMSMNLSKRRSRDGKIPLARSQ